MECVDVKILSDQTHPCSCYLTPAHCILRHGVGSGLLAGHALVGRAPRVEISIGRGVGVVTYIPEWEPLAAAVTRVMAAGAKKNDAKRDLCSAIADGNIAVRVRLAEEPYRNLPATVLSDLNLDVPSYLSPSDFDWRQSRPLKKWPIAQKYPGEMILAFFARAGHLVERRIDLIELRTSDVAELLCASGSSSQNEPTSIVQNFKAGPGAKSLGIEQAIRAMWPKKIPTGLTAKDRNNQIVKWLKEHDCSVPSTPARAIQRVLKNLR
jgi:hypothetical protein